MPCRFTASRADSTLESRPMDTGGGKPSELIGSVWNMSSTTLASAAACILRAAVRAQPAGLDPIVTHGV